jgi:hypothetical protein
MATGNTSVADVVVPRIFTPYTQKLTEEKSRIVASGAVVRSGVADGMLAGGGITFDLPAWNDLDNDADNVSTDAASLATPNKIGSHQQVAVRLSRNQHWSGFDLAQALAGSDPMAAIANRVAAYWSRRLQAATIATMNGVFKDNGVNDSNDYTVEIVGAGFVDGVTNFSAEAYIDAAATMGDSTDDLSLLLVHSTVYARMQKNNLIDFIPDARGETQIASFLGAMVVIDDGMPSGTGVTRADGTTAGVAGMFESWLFGPGAIQWGVGSPRVPTEVDRVPLDGDGGGREILSSRVEWTIHPDGHSYTGTAASGGPSNATTANNLNAAASWNRVWPERKQVKVARLISRES